MVSRYGDPLELMYVSDLVVGMSSQLLFEAYLMRLNILSILPRLVERSWLPITRDGVIPCATRKFEIHKMLSKFFIEIEKKSDNVVLEHNDSICVVRNSVDRCLSFLNTLLI